MTDCVQSDIQAFGIAGEWKATALKAEVWIETVTGGWAEVHGRVEEIRGRRGWTWPGEERSNETGKLVIAHGSVEFCEATPFELVDEPKKFLDGRETDRDLRSACRCVA